MKKIPDDIRELENKISHFKNGEKIRQNFSSDLKNAGTLALGVRIAVELLSAIIVGGAIGFVIDRMTGMFPFFLVTFLLFGGAAGFLNVYRLSKAYEEEKGRENK